MHVAACGIHGTEKRPSQTDRLDTSIISRCFDFQKIPHAPLSNLRRTTFAIFEVCSGFQCQWFAKEIDSLFDLLKFVGFIRFFHSHGRYSFTGCPCKQGDENDGTCTTGPWILKTIDWGLCFARKHAMLVTFGTRTRDGWQGCCLPEQFFRATRDRLKSWKSPHFNWFNDLCSYDLSGLHDGQLRMISDASYFSWAGCEMCSSIFASWLCRNTQWNPNDRKIPK